MALRHEEPTVASTSRRLRRRYTELNHSPPRLHGKPLHALRKCGRYVKLNYQLLLPGTNSTGITVSSPPVVTRVPVTPIRTDSARNRSNPNFFRSALHTAHGAKHIRLRCTQTLLVIIVSICARPFHIRPQFVVLCCCLGIARGWFGDLEEITAKNRKIHD